MHANAYSGTLSAATTLTRVNLRHLQYLVVLAEERHFHRAAERLHIGQSTLSAALRQLETEAGVVLVERDRRRFGGLTDAGVVAVGEARRIVAACAGLETALASIAGDPVGRITLGVIPTAEPLLPELTRALAEAAPRVTLLERLLTTREVVQGVLDRSLHGGIAYVDFTPDPALELVPLYAERYVVCGPRHMLPSSTGPMSWARAAALPLAVLSPDMRNRQILDRHFASLGVGLAPALELNSVLAVLSHVRAGSHCAILPEAAAPHAAAAGIVTRRLGEPSLSVPVGLMVRRDEPLQPLPRALVAAATRAWPFEDVGRASVPRDAASASGPRDRSAEAITRS